MEKKILDRINKLLALSKNPNVNEGNSAMEMAEKLMSENGISYSDLDASKLENDLGPINTNEPSYKKGSISPWKRNLAQVIAEHFGCISFMSQKRSVFGSSTETAMMFLGHESNRITAEIMYDWLRKLIIRECNQKIKSGEIENREAMSFCMGVVMSLRAKYHTEKSDIVTNCPAVVDEVQKFAEEKLNLKTAKARALSIYSGASQKGKEVGNNLSLNRQFGLKQIGA